MFAPTNEAFAALPKGTVETLLKPENKDKLTAVLTYHVVPGRYTAEDIASQDRLDGRQADAQDGAGRGAHLRAQRRDHLTVTDAKGDVARITIADVLQSNGVIHVVNKVLIPG